MNKIELLATQLIRFKKDTGSYFGSDPEYNHIYLPVEFSNLDLNSDYSIELFEYLARICEKEPLISITKITSKPTKFLYLTSIDNYTTIKEQGLILDKSNNIPDLGKGIYVVNTEETFNFGMTNLIEWAKNSFRDNNGFVSYDTELCVVNFNYEGEYLECIHGFNHEGYITLKKPISNDSLTIKTMTLASFLDSALNV